MWWDPTDQAVLEAPMVDRRDLGRGWIDVAMVNNVERPDPLGDDERSTAVRAPPAARRLVALDEGQAWRHRKDGALVVLRLEAFADPDQAAHREAWWADGAASLEATWRQRWRERDRTPGWVEARRVEPDDWPDATSFAPSALAGRPAPDVIDWITVEDHTGAGDHGTVACYQHLTVWAGRGHGIVVLRHDLGLDAADVVLRVALAAWAGLASALDPSAPR